MIGRYRVRTDLALENGEKFEKDHVEIAGVVIRRQEDREREIVTTVVKIESESGARAMGKPQGVYITLEAPNLAVPDEGIHREISRALAAQLTLLLPRKMDSVLVVGLGHRSITPDALGPCAVEHLHITRHMIREYGERALGDGKIPMISALVPGVMAQTGMETLEILQGVIRETEPDVVLAIDALAARNTRRLNCTIQITDTGISPGSGVGNHRCGLNQETLHVPVIGIGVPTVVDAGTIVHDAVSNLLEALEDAEMDEFLSELVSPALRGMFVTPKDIDETIARLSFTLSEGINMALKRESYSGSLSHI